MTAFRMIYPAPPGCSCRLFVAVAIGIDLRLCVRHLFARGLSLEGYVRRCDVVFVIAASHLRLRNAQFATRLLACSLIPIFQVLSLPHILFEFLLCRAVTNQAIGAPAIC